MQGVFLTVLVVCESISLLVYLLIMFILSFPKKSALSTEFFSQSWILGVFDIFCYLCNAVMRYLRNSKSDISLVYSFTIMAKIMTSGHQMAMTLINVSRFRILYNHTLVNSDNSISLWCYRFSRGFSLLFLAILLDFHRIVLIFTEGWPDYSYNYGIASLDFILRTASTLVVFIPCTICVFLNLFIVWKWSQSTVLETLNSGRNGRHVLYAGLIVLTTLPVTVYQCLKFYGTLIDNQMFLTSVTKYFDVSYFSLEFGNAYILLSMNKKLRKEFLGLFSLSRFTKHSAVVVRSYS